MASAISGIDNSNLSKMRFDWPGDKGNNINSNAMTGGGSVNTTKAQDQSQLDKASVSSEAQGHSTVAPSAAAHPATQADKSGGSERIANLQQGLAHNFGALTTSHQAGTQQGSSQSQAVQYQQAITQAAAAAQ